MSPFLSTITSTGSSITSSIHDTECLDDLHLSIHSDMAAIVKTMASSESVLEVCGRMWLQIAIPSAFIGLDVMDLLYHTVNKVTFSEQCSYIFGDLCGNMANVSLHDYDGSRGASDQNTWAPLSHPVAAPWSMAFPYQYLLPPLPYSLYPGFPELWQVQCL